MRRRAADGTKISTPLSITNKTDSTSRRASRERDSNAETSADRRGQPEQRIPDHDPGMIERDMGELRAARGVADRERAPVGRAQPAIDGDASDARLDAGGGEVERSGVRTPTGGDQQM